MKDYKLLLAGLILLLLFISIAIFAWLYTSNRKNTDPLPIMTNDNKSMVTTTPDDANSLNNSAVYLQAEKSLQTPLDDIIARFESRYPHIDVVANYVPASHILNLPDTDMSKQTKFIFDVDMIITNDRLSTERLAPLQAELKAAQDNIKQSKAHANNANESGTGSLFSDEEEEDTNRNINMQARTLTSFSYALKDDQTLDGVILTDNTAAITFRNFLLSSTGQDILKEYDYYNIEGYKNSVNDLFNPTSRTQQVPETSSINVADALSNGEQ